VERIIRTKNASIRLLDAGGTEPAAVFLHYWGGSARTWRYVARLLSDRVRCICLDQRGWGQSSASDERYDLEAMADDAAAVIAALGLHRFVLVGHSMGGKVAQILAARQPDGLEGLVLVAPAPPVPMPVPQAARHAMLESYGSRVGVQQALQILASRPLSAEDQETVIEDTLRGLPAAKRAWTDDGMTMDLGKRLSMVTVPTVIVVGDQDRVENAATLRTIFSDALHHAEMHVLAGIGHLSPLEAPQELALLCHTFIDRIANSAAGQPPTNDNE
jgi:pimeloyl-ACP methyl ester carboxylesterase